MLSVPTVVRYLVALLSYNASYVPLAFCLFSWTLDVMVFCLFPLGRERTEAESQSNVCNSTLFVQFCGTCTIYDCTCILVYILIYVRMY